MLKNYLEWKNSSILLLRINCNPWRSIFAQTWTFGVLCKQLKIQIRVNCVQSVCQCCVCWGEYFQTIGNKFANYRNKRPFVSTANEALVGTSIGSLSMRVFETRTATRRENFACQDSAVSQIFILIISNGEKILSNENVFVGRQVKRENNSLPLAVRVSKTRVLKLPKWQ